MSNKDWEKIATEWMLRAEQAEERVRELKKSLDGVIAGGLQAKLDMNVAFNETERERDAALQRVRELEAAVDYWRPSCAPENVPASRCVVISDYWSDSHRPYRGQLRDPDTDECLNLRRVVDELLVNADIRDGDEVEIVLYSTGRRPFGDRKVRFVRAHTYERETKEECLISVKKLPATD